MENSSYWISGYLGISGGYNERISAKTQDQVDHIEALVDCQFDKTDFDYGAQVEITQAETELHDA